jgi:hypothetical protein
MLKSRDLEFQLEQVGEMALKVRGAGPMIFALISSGVKPHRLFPESTSLEVVMDTLNSKGVKSLSNLVHERFSALKNTMMSSKEKGSPSSRLCEFLGIAKRSEWNPNSAPAQLRHLVENPQIEFEIQQAFSSAKYELIYDLVSWLVDINED